MTPAGVRRVHPFDTQHLFDVVHPVDAMHPFDTIHPYDFSHPFDFIHPFDWKEISRLIIDEFNRDLIAGTFFSMTKVVSQQERRDEGIQE
jgi:hypothetical protein